MALGFRLKAFGALENRENKIKNKNPQKKQEEEKKRKNRKNN